MQVPTSRLRQSVWMGVTSGTSFAGAVGCAGLLASVDAVPPLLPALAAGLTLAGIERGLDLRSPHRGIDFTASTLATWGASFLMALVALALVVRIVPASVPFVCDPIVPWRISIVFFGAFACAWVVEGLRLRASDRHLAPLVHIGLGWIAPFYGFFHAPWFLAQSVVMPCAGRPVVQSILATIGMILAGLAGTAVAKRMFSSAP